MPERTKLRGRAARWRTACRVQFALWPETEDDLHALHIYDFAHPRAPASAVSYAAGVMVEPMFRGRGFHRLLIEVRMVVNAHVGRLHHFASASLANPYSWRNLLQMGGRVIGLYEFTDPRYGDTSRLFTYQSPSPKRLSDELVWIDSLDLEAHRTRLSDGLVGTEHRMVGSITQLGYQREIS